MGYFKDDDWELNSFELIKKLPQNVQTEMQFAISVHLEEYLQFIDDCESPIEQAMGIWLYDIFVKTPCDYIVKVEAQKEITIGKHTYRADFLVTAVRNPEDEPLKIVIECDGHDYHERTKEQAVRDKRRDRDLIIGGYQVLRFTGSEIWESTLHCANQVLILIRSHFAKRG